MVYTILFDGEDGLVTNGAITANGTQVATVRPMNLDECLKLRNCGCIECVYDHLSGLPDSGNCKYDEFFGNR